MAGDVTLDTDVKYVTGVGPWRAAQFAKLGVHTVADLIEFFPFRHELRPRSQAIGTLEFGAVATVVGEVRRVRPSGPLHNRTISAQVVDGTGECHVRWFNSSYVSDKLRNCSAVRLTGKVDLYRERASFTNPLLTVVDDGEDPFAADHDRYEPVYPATSQLPSRKIAQIVRRVLDGAVKSLPDFVPQALRARRNLPLRRTAIVRFHHPTSTDDIPIARRRIVYEEFLLFQLAVQLSRRRQSAGPKAQAIQTSAAVDERIRKRFPFDLTAGQDRAVEEIRTDLARTVPMNRMLQADVGAGKTAVAVYAALAAIAKRRQVALIAPTEILASQHHAKIERYLAGSRVRVGFLAGSTAKSKRKPLLATLAAGEIDWLIGTHALLETAVRFRDLGLVVIDEQHKFGVAQRAALRDKAQAPHTLVLSATPIPRTLAMSVFGDLDVSTIDELPPGRQPVTTRLVTQEKTDEAWAFVRSKLKRGEQAFVVYPLVEESEALPLKAATVEVERLSRDALPGVSIGLLHGRMKSSKKSEVMERFRSGEIKVLVSTTVVEVGVDVPNATMMIVQHAERYGLSQLHQLRGRIGRGSKKAFCLLFADPKAETSVARLSILCETNDGFRIAEEDLRLRGPGELMGTRQHGLPSFRVANLVTDFEVLELARDDAAEILRADAELKHPEHVLLRRTLLQRYSKTIDLIDVA